MTLLCSEFRRPPHCLQSENCQEKGGTDRKPLMGGKRSFGVPSLASILILQLPYKRPLFLISPDTNPNQEGSCDLEGRGQGGVGDQNNKVQITWKSIFQEFVTCQLPDIFTPKELLSTLLSDSS